MKAAIILLITIFACASARLIQSEVYTGFTNKLGVTKEQHAELQSCAMEVAGTAQKYLAPGKAAIRSMLLNFLFADDAKHRETILGFEQYLQTALPACRKFAVSLVSIFAKATYSTEELHMSPSHVVMYRISAHMDVIVSSLVAFVDQAKAGKSTQAGETLSYLFQVLTGMIHPETIQDYVKNYKQPIEVSVMEVDTFIQKTINAAAKELGHTEEVPVHRIKELREAVQHFAVVHMGTQMQLQKANSIVDRQVIILGAVRDLVKVAAVVGENVQIIAAPYVKSVNVRGINKGTVLNAIHNYYLNVATIQRRSVDIVMGVQAHHPVQVGKAFAEIVKTLTNVHH